MAIHLDPAFALLGGTYLYSKASARQAWQFVICCAGEPLDVMKVDAQTGAVMQLSDDEIRIIRERAAIYIARQQGLLPVNAQGYVIGEYARRQAERYLGDAIALLFKAVDPVFVPNYPPRWQVRIVFKCYPSDPFTLDFINVDAKTGEPIPLTQQQLDHIHGRVQALRR